MTLLRRANVHGRRTTPGDRVVVGRVEVLVAHGEGGVLVVRTLAPRLGRLRGSEVGGGGGGGGGARRPDPDASARGQLNELRGRELSRRGWAEETSGARRVPGIEAHLGRVVGQDGFQQLVVVDPHGPAARLHGGGEGSGWMKKNLRSGFAISPRRA